MESSMQLPPSRGRREARNEEPEPMQLPPTPSRGRREARNEEPERVEREPTRGDRMFQIGREIGRTPADGAARSDGAVVDLRLIQVATLVLAGWLFVTFCFYWQHQILQPYLKSLLWAAIFSMSFRRFWPLVSGSAEIIVPSILENLKSPVKYCWSFLTRPWNTLYAEYMDSLEAFPSSSACFQLLTYAWVLYVLWWIGAHTLAQQTLTKAMVMMIISWGLGSAVVFPRLAPVIVVAIATTAWLYQLREELFLVQRLLQVNATASLFPSLWGLNGGVGALVSPDVCQIAMGQLALAEEDASTFLSACTAMQEALASYMGYSNESVVEEATEEEEWLWQPSCNATSRENSMCIAGVEVEVTPPFQRLVTTLETALQRLLADRAPETLVLIHQVDAYFGFTAAASSDSPSTQAADFGSVREAAMGSWQELMQLANLSGIAARAPEAGRLAVRVGWDASYSLLMGLYLFATRSFDAFFQVLVFLSATWHLCAVPRGGVSGPMRSLMQGTLGDKGLELHNRVDHAIFAVLSAPLKFALFHSMFTCLLLVCFESPVVCVPTGFAAILSVIAPTSAIFVALAFGAYLWLTGSWLSASIVLTASALVWYFVPDAIYSDIPGAHPFLTGLTVVMGASCLGPVGCVAGPVLLAVPYVVIASMLAPPDDTRGQPGMRRMRSRASRVMTSTFS